MYKTSGKGGYPLIHVFFGPLLLGISLAAPVGPINLEVMKQGIQRGFWHAWLVGLGGMSADIGFMFLIYFGISHYLTSYEVQTFLLCSGSLMLGFLGMQSMKIQPNLETQPDTMTRKKPLSYSYIVGLLIAGVNPINLLFWLGVYGSVLTERLESLGEEYALIYSCMIFVGIALWNLLIVLTVHFGKTLLNPIVLRLITITAGLVLIGYGIHFGWQGFHFLMDMGKEHTTLLLGQ